QVNFGEWIIYNDKSFTDFLRVPNDYIDQIKLTILEIYVRKEPKTSQQRSPLSVDVHPRLENRNSVYGFSITQSTDFPNMTHYQNILTGLPQRDRNIAPSYGLDNYFGQSSHFEMTKNVKTSSNFHVSPTFDEDDYRNGKYHIDPVNINDRDLQITAHLQLVIVMICLMPRNQEIMFHLRHHLVMMIFNAQSVSQDQYIFGDTHDEYTSQRTRCKSENFMNGAIYIEKG
ncbi:hypothetical protein H5410_025724, partial [Solanum commersonii]